ncbi:MAG: hypothetical protein JWO81_2005 [Alphaproteobacteria bacterium]|nr:hypothetical protein [Alphaproteobacteria bacterium]
MTARTIIAGIALLLLAGAAPRQDRPAVWPSAERTLDDKEAILRAAADFPHSSQLQRRLLGAALEAKNAAQALGALERLAAMGGTLSQPSRALLVPLVGAAAMARLAPLFDANAAPIGGSRIFATIPADDQLVEGLAWDDRRHELYAASVYERRLFRLDPPDRASAVTQAQPAGLFGTQYDARRGVLWLASSVAGAFANAPGGFNGIVRVDPGGGTLRIPAPAGAGQGIGDVVVAADGDVYASDGTDGAIFRCRPSCGTLEIFLPAGTFFSAQGMALSADQARLYVADYRYGLAMVDRATGKVDQVAGAPTMMLDGIDGLVRFGRDLIAIQNGFRPARIVRLHLSGDGRRVARLDILERGNPAWGEPTLGTVAGSRLLYVSDSQWERFDGGKVTLPPRPTPVRELSLGGSAAEARRR